VYGYRDGVAETNSLLTTISGTLTTISDTLTAGFSSLEMKLDTVNGHLTDIYDRLEHIKVDSYVNVRVVDEFGIAAIPCTEFTGLLVSAVVANPLPVSVDGTVPVTITSQPILVAPSPTSPPFPTEVFNTVSVNPNVFDVISQTWRSAAGISPPDNYQYSANNIAHYYPTGTTAMPFAGVTAILGTGTSVNAAIMNSIEVEPAGQGLYTTTLPP